MSGIVYRIIFSEKCKTLRNSAYTSAYLCEKSYWQFIISIGSRQLFISFFRRLAPIHRDRQPAEYRLPLYLAALLIFLSVSMVQAQTPVGNYRSGFKKQGNEVTFSATNADVRIDFCTPSMFRVQVSWSRSFHNDESLMVTRYHWPNVKVAASDKGDHFLLQTDKIKVLVNKAPFRIEVETPDGRIISSESSKSNIDTSHWGALKKGDAVLCRKALMPGEHFFGFGERMDFIDQRGKDVHLNVGRGIAHSHIMGAYNVMKANYCPVPFFMSTRGYGIFFHNSYATDWDMGHSNPAGYAFKAAGGELDYYFIYGPDFPKILDQYTGLTGKSPMMPRFAYGLQVGTYSGGTWGHVEDASPHYVVNLGRKLRDEDIPADILWLDSTWRYFGKLGHGGTTFQWRSVFKRPEAMLDSLYAMHYHMVGVHIRPFLDNGTKLHLLDAARKHGGVLYPADGRLGDMVNFFNPPAVDWWWNNAVMKVASIGVKFVKTDAGNSFRYRGDNKSLAHKVDSLHNLFPIAYAKAPYEEFMKYNKVRGMNQTREGYAGIQRYPYIFAGDWPSRWQYFGPVIKAGLNIGLSGVGYWAHCMGGFEQKADPELYIRWTQFGLLSPVATLFGMDHPGYKEPWNYGEKALENFRKYDKLRYRLMPYIYTTAHENHITGLPMMRALVLEYQNDVNTYDIADQYLFGDFMLVCPVTVKGANERVVYLPEGTWYNYWTGEKMAGKRHLTVPAPLEQMPIFIKAGAIIPMQAPVKYIGQEPVDTLTLDIYPGGNSTYSIYDDDGKSLAYQKGVYATTKITCHNDENGIEVAIHPPEGNYKVPERSYKLNIHMDNPPESVYSDGKKLMEISKPAKYKKSIHTSGWYYDESQNVLYVRPGGSSKKKITVEIRR